MWAGRGAAELGLELARLGAILPALEVEQVGNEAIGPAVEARRLSAEHLELFTPRCHEDSFSACDARIPKPCVPRDGHRWMLPRHARADDCLYAPGDRCVGVNRRTSTQVLAVTQPSQSPVTPVRFNAAYCIRSGQLRGDIPSNLGRVP